MTYNRAAIMKSAWTLAREKFAQLSEPSSLNCWGRVKPNLRELFADALRNAWRWAKWEASAERAAHITAESDPKIVALRGLIACEEAKERQVDWAYIETAKDQIRARLEELRA